MDQHRVLRAVFFSHLATMTGAERSLLELTRELTQNFGADCTVVLPEDGPLRKELNNVGAKTIRGPVNWWCGQSGVPSSVLEKNIIESMPGIFALFEQIAMVDPHVIASNTRTIAAGLIISNLLEKPHVTFAREPEALVDSFSWLLGANNTSKLFYALSAAVICNSEDTADQFEENEKVEIINTHIRLPKNIAPVKSIHKKTRAIKLILPGSLTPIKGQEDAIRAIDLLKNKGTSVELVLMGGPEGVHSEKLRAMVASLGLQAEIQFLPFQEQPYAYYQQADIVLVCSRGESFGRAAGEALTLGIPLIATNIKGLKKQAIDSETALTYSPGDFVTLAKHIEKITANPNLASKLAQAGKIHMQQFSEDKFGGAVWRRFIEVKGVQSGHETAEPALKFRKRINEWTSRAFQEKAIKAQDLEEKTTNLQTTNEDLRRDLQAQCDQADDLQRGLRLTQQALRDVTNSKTWLYRDKILRIPGLKTGWRGVRRILK